MLSVQLRPARSEFVAGGNGDAGAGAGEEALSIVGGFCGVLVSWLSARV